MVVVIMEQVTTIDTGVATAIGLVMILVADVHGQAIPIDEAASTGVTHIASASGRVIAIAVVAASNGAVVVVANASVMVAMKEVLRVRCC